MLIHQEMDAMEYYLTQSNWKGNRVYSNIMKRTYLQKQVRPFVTIPIAMRYFSKLRKS